MKATRLCSLLLLTLGLTACTPRVRLDPITPVATDRLPVAVHVEVPPSTANATPDVYSYQGGGCTIEVGRAIVQYADAYLGSAFQPGNDVTVRVELDSFEVRNFEARMDMRYTIARGGQQVSQ